MTAGILTMDLHGKTICQARVTLNAAFKRTGSGTCRLRVIHGCHSGTALRNMIRQNTLITSGSSGCFLPWTAALPSGSCGNRKEGHPCALH